MVQTITLLGFSASRFLETEQRNPMFLRKLNSAAFNRFMKVSKARPRNGCSDRVGVSFVHLPTSYPSIRSIWHRILGPCEPYSNLRHQDPKTPTCFQKRAEYELWFLEQDALASGNRSRTDRGPHKVILARKPDRRSTKLCRNESKISNSHEVILEKVRRRPLILQHSLIVFLKHYTFIALKS